MKLRNEYQEVDLQAVLNYFAKDFQLPEGQVLWSHEAFIDPVKKKVIFKLIIDSDPA